MADEAIQQFEERVHRFIDTLKRLERSGDTDDIAQLFTEDAEIGNNVAPRSFHGQDGARQFWQEHRDVFGQMSSSFRNMIIASDGRAALEWVIEGTTPDGRPARQQGVSILEWQGDQIRRFRAYIDSRELGRHLQAS